MQINVLKLHFLSSHFLFNKKKKKKTIPQLFNPETKHHEQK